MRGIEYDDNFDILADSLHKCKGLDLVCICRDLNVNAKIGNKEDYAVNLDNVLNRDVIDETVNRYEHVSPIKEDQ